MSKFSKENNGYKYVLSVIDVFSKYAWMLPIFKKNSTNIIQAFSKIFKERKPLKIHSDKGKEFLNGEFQKFLKKQNVSLYTINSEMKASVVERFNRTIKERMWRYFSYKRTHKYIDILNDLIFSYNHSFHRSIKTKPVLVNKSNEEDTFFNLYGFKKKNFQNLRSEKE